MPLRSYRPRSLATSRHPSGPAIPQRYDISALQKQGSRTGLNAFALAFALAFASRYCLHARDKQPHALHGSGDLALDYFSWSHDEVETLGAYDAPAILYGSYVNRVVGHQEARVHSCPRVIR